MDEDSIKGNRELILATCQSKYYFPFVPLLQSAFLLFLAQLGHNTCYHCKYIYIHKTSYEMSCNFVVKAI